MKILTPKNFVSCALVVILFNPIFAYADQQQSNPQNQTFTNCHCIAFRLEFVQDTFLNNVQNTIIQTFDQKNASFTIGMAGKDIGNNPKVVGLIKDRLRDSNPPLVIANRGWDNLDHTQFPEEQQSASIKQSSDKISRIFGVTPLIFIPPFDKFNNDTLSAAQENGIKYLSSNSKLDPGPYDFKNTTLLHIPTTATMAYLLDDDPFFKGKILDKAMAKIQLSLIKNGFSVISIRSQDFAVNSGTTYKNLVDGEKLQDLESLLDTIKENKIKIVTIDEVPQDAGQKSPSWVNNLNIWYERGDISQNDILNAINYLIDIKVITYSN